MYTVLTLLLLLMSPQVGRKWKNKEPGSFGVTPCANLERKCSPERGMRYELVACRVKKLPSLISSSALYSAHGSNAVIFPSLLPSSFLCFAGRLAVDNVNQSNRQDD